MLDEDLVTAGVVLLPLKEYFQPHTVLTILVVQWMSIRGIKGQEKKFLLFTTSLHPCFTEGKHGWCLLAPVLLCVLSPPSRSLWVTVTADPCPAERGLAQPVISHRVLNALEYRCLVERETSAVLYCLPVAFQFIS